MATKRYQEWNALGRPLAPAQPIREIVERMNDAYPEAAKAHLFSWHADDAHYQAVNPLDHTPFSNTPWPDPLPGWIVCATDIMHRPDLGVDCEVLFPYWLAEAEAGRMPWLKYMIWRRKSHSVRSNWVAKPADDHDGHIHLSIRTDHLKTSLGSWELVPGKATRKGRDVITVIEDADNPGTFYAWSGDRVRRLDLTGLPNGVGDVGWVLSGKWSGPGTSAAQWAVHTRAQCSNEVIAAAPHIRIPRVPVRLLPVTVEAAPAPVDAEAVAAALLASPGFAETLEDAAFEGAQRAEQE